MSTQRTSSFEATPKQTLLKKYCSTNTTIIVNIYIIKCIIECKQVDFFSLQFSVKSQEYQCNPADWSVFSLPSRMYNLYLCGTSVSAAPTLSLICVPLETACVLDLLKPAAAVSRLFKRTQLEEPLTMKINLLSYPPCPVCCCGLKTHSHLPLHRKRERRGCCSNGLLNFSFSFDF